jgi:hypothetical protein
LGIRAFRYTGFSVVGLLGIGAFGYTGFSVLKPIWALFAHEKKNWHILTPHIMLRDELTQMTSQKISVTDFRYPRACRIRKYQFENRQWELPLPTFLKRDLNS